MEEKEYNVLEDIAISKEDPEVEKAQRNYKKVLGKEQLIKVKKEELKLRKQSEKEIREIKKKPFLETLSRKWDEYVKLLDISLPLTLALTVFTLVIMCLHSYGIGHVMLYNMEKIHPVFVFLIFAGAGLISIIFEFAAIAAKLENENSLAYTITATSIIIITFLLYYEINVMKTEITGLNAVRIIFSIAGLPILIKAASTIAKRGKGKGKYKFDEHNIIGKYRIMQIIKAVKQEKINYESAPVILAGKTKKGKKDRYRRDYIINKVDFVLTSNTTKLLETELRNLAVLHGVGSGKYWTNWPSTKAKKEKKKNAQKQADKKEKVYETSPEHLKEKSATGVSDKDNISEDLNIFLNTLNISLEQLHEFFQRTPEEKVIELARKYNYPSQKIKNIKKEVVKIFTTKS